MVVELESVMLLALDVLRGPYVCCHAPMHEPAAKLSSIIVDTRDMASHDVWRTVLGNEEAPSSPDSPIYGSDAAFRAAYAVLSGQKTTKDTNNSSSIDARSTIKIPAQHANAAASMVSRVSRLTDMLVPRSEFCRRVLWLFEAESGVLYVYYPEEIVAEHYQRKTLRYSLCLTFRLPPHYMSIGETLVNELILPYAAVLLNVAEELRAAELKYNYVSDGLANQSVDSMMHDEHEPNAAAGSTKEGKTNEGGSEEHAVKDNDEEVLHVDVPDVQAGHTSHEETQTTGVQVSQTHGQTLNCFVTPCTSHTWHSLNTVVTDLYNCLRTTSSSLALTTSKSVSDPTVLFLSDRFFIHVHRPPALRPMHPVYYDDIAVPLRRTISDNIVTAEEEEGIDLAVSRVFALVDGRRCIAELILSLALDRPVTLSQLLHLTTAGEEEDTGYEEDAHLSLHANDSHAITPWSRRSTPRFAIVPDREAEPRRWLLYIQQENTTANRKDVPDAKREEAASKPNSQEESKEMLRRAATTTAARLSSSLGEKSPPPSASLAVNNNIAAYNKTRIVATSQDNIPTNKSWYQGGTPTTTAATAHPTTTAAAATTSSSVTLEPSSSNETQRALSRGSGEAVKGLTNSGSAAIPTTTTTTSSNNNAAATTAGLRLTGAGHTNTGTTGTSNSTTTTNSHGHMPSSGQSIAASAGLMQGRDHSPPRKAQTDILLVSSNPPTSSTLCTPQQLLLFELPESWLDMALLVREAVQHLEQAGMLRLVRPLRATTTYSTTRTLHEILTTPAHPAREGLGRYMMRVDRLVSRARSMRKPRAKAAATTTCIKREDKKNEADGRQGDASKATYAADNNNAEETTEEEQLRLVITASLCALSKYTHCTLGVMRGAMRRVPALRNCFHGWCHECCRALTELAVLNDWLVEEPNMSVCV